jgi:hypothetical protein
VIRVLAVILVLLALPARAEMSCEQETAYARARCPEACGCRVGECKTWASPCMRQPYCNYYDCSCSDFEIAQCRREQEILRLLKKP